MDVNTFIKTVSQRIGANNTLQQLNPVQQGALIELFIEKGTITQDELDAKTNAGFAKLAHTIMTMPVPSSIKPFQ